MKHTSLFSHFSLLVSGIFGAAALLLLPHATSAHVKWFAEEPLKTRPYEITESWVIIWIVAVLLVILVGFVYEKKYPPKRTSRKRWNKDLVRFFQIAVGLALMITALQGHIFAPNMDAGSDIATQALRAGELAAGLLIMIGAVPQLAAGLLLVVYGAAMFVFGVESLIEHCEIPAVALAYALVNSSPGQFLHRYAHLSLPVLRIGVGTSLIVLAFTEKLLDPSLAANFLLNHNWNFMELLGFNWFDDRLFILSAGMTELLIGLLFVLGLIIRFNILAFSGVIISTAILLGPAEVIGHMPIIAAVVVLAVYGAGKYTASSFFKSKRRGGSSGSSSSADDSDE